VTLFRHSAVGFAELAMEGTLAVRIAEQMRYHTGRRAAPAEFRSWERSLPILAQDLIQAGLDNVEVLIEHHLPLTSKRADVVLAGRHPKTGGPSYVVVELKQWSRAAAWQDDRELVLIDGYPNAPGFIRSRRFAGNATIWPTSPSSSTARRMRWPAPPTCTTRSRSPQYAISTTTRRTNAVGSSSERAGRSSPTSYVNGSTRRCQAARTPTS
jgi:hypothetical protein